MNRITFILLLLVIATGTFTATAQSPAEKQNTFLSALREKGQQFSLKEVGGRYEFIVMEGVATVYGHKVMEIGADYVVVQDVAGVTESRIPLWSIKAIIKLKMPMK